MKEGCCRNEMYSKFRALKYILTIFLIIGSINNSWSCSCSSESTFIDAAKSSKLIIKGKALKQDIIEPSRATMGYNVVQFEIMEILKGESIRDTIKIAESTGYECFGSHFIDGKEYYVQGEILAIHDLNSNNQLITTDQIMIPAECSQSTLMINSNRVCGKISIYPNKLTNWYYKLTGKLEKVKLANRETYIECMSIDKLSKKLVKYKYE